MKDGSLVSHDTNYRTNSYMLIGLVWGEVNLGLRLPSMTYNPVGQHPWLKLPVLVPKQVKNSKISITRGQVTKPLSTESTG